MEGSELGLWTDDEYVIQDKLISFYEIKLVEGSVATGLRNTLSKS